MKAKRAVPSYADVEQALEQAIMRVGHHPLHAFVNFERIWIAQLPKTEVAPSQPRLHPDVLDDIGPYVAAPGQGRILADQFKKPVRRNHRDDDQRA